MVTLVSIIGVPIGILTSVFMARYCPKKALSYFKTRCRAFGRDSFGHLRLFGLVVLVPLIRTVFGGNGNSILTASILLGIMILPTIMGVSESAIRAVPTHYYEGALALGATKRAIHFCHSAACGLVPALWLESFWALAVLSVKPWL